MKVREVCGYLSMIPSFYFIDGPWLFAYNGAPHGFFVSNNGDYTLIEQLIWAIIIGLYQIRIYISAKYSKTVISFCLKSEFTTACIAILIMMEWHHNPLIVVVYIIWCLICGSATFYLHRFGAREWQSRT